MTSSPLSTITTEVERDRFGRPYIVPPGGGKAVPYTRCTTFVGACEDTYKISQWSQRHTAHGVARHDDIIAALRDTNPDDKDSLNALVEEAKERSGAGDAARFGTYMHKVTEAFDRGEDPALVPLPLQSYGYPPADAYVPDLAAYVEATKDLKPVLIEQMMVHDDLKVAGTPDRVVEYQGHRFIDDLKTGHIHYGPGKIAAQLAMYAHSVPYDILTGTRLEAHGASLDRGLVIHLPAGTGTCEVKWVDLRAGWEVAKTCGDVRDKRRLSASQLYTPLGGKTDRSLNKILAALPLPETTPLEEQITNAPTRETITTLWQANSSVWTEALTELAKARLARLEAS